MFREEGDNPLRLSVETKPDNLKQCQLAYLIDVGSNRSTCILEPGMRLRFVRLLGVSAICLGALAEPVEASSEWIVIRMGAHMRRDVTWDQIRSYMLSAFYQSNPGEGRHRTGHRRSAPDRGGGAALSSYRQDLELRSRWRRKRHERRDCDRAAAAGATGGSCQWHTV